MSRAEKADDHTMMSGLPWQKMFGPRCKAVREPRDGHTFGRCELQPHGPEILHALERAMDIPRWSTDWVPDPARRVPDSEKQ